MKLILIVADAARLDRVRADLAAGDAPGYTVFEVLEGAGRTGLHTGSRVHPGGLTALAVVDSDDHAPILFDELARRRADSGDEVMRLFMMPVEKAHP
jgi:hypothetical protein